jgi:hypothetical protein
MINYCCCYLLYAQTLHVVVQSCYGDGRSLARSGIFILIQIQPNNVTTEWSALLLCVREVLGSNLGRRLPILTGSSWFSSAPSGKSREAYVKLDHDRFLPFHFLLIIHLSSQHPMLYVDMYTVWAVRSWNTGKLILSFSWSDTWLVSGRPCSGWRWVTQFQPGGDSFVQLYQWTHYISLR